MTAKISLAIKVGDKVIVKDGATRRFVKETFSTDTGIVLDIEYNKCEEKVYLVTFGPSDFFHARLKEEEIFLHIRASAAKIALFCHGFVRTIWYIHEQHFETMDFSTKHTNLKRFSSPSSRCYANKNGHISCEL